MKGLEKSEKLFREHGLPMLHEKYSGDMNSFAAGLCGAGSECFGYDDEISNDHDMTTEFCLFVPDTISDKLCFQLERDYHKLVKEYSSNRECASSGMNTERRGVIRQADFFRKYTGRSGAPESWQDWMYTPESCFAEVLNGKIFFDPSGSFSAVRDAIRTGMPAEVWIKKIAARAAQMAQSGQYNYSRCLEHSEPGAAMLALSSFVTSTASMIFLLNRSFCPYYKWAIRAMRALPILGDMADVLEFLLVAANGEDDNKEKKQIIEDISALVIKELKKENLSDSPSDFLEAHAIEAMKRIKSTEIRALHLMTG